MERDKAEKHEKRIAELIVQEAKLEENAARHSQLQRGLQEQLRRCEEKLSRFGGAHTEGDDMNVTKNGTIGATSVTKSTVTTPATDGDPLLQRIRQTPLQRLLSSSSRLSLQSEGDKVDHPKSQAPEVERCKATPKIGSDSHVEGTEFSEKYASKAISTTSIAATSATTMVEAGLSLPPSAKERRRSESELCSIRSTAERPPYLTEEFLEQTDQSQLTVMFGGLHDTVLLRQMMKLTTDETLALDGDYPDGSHRRKTILSTCACLTSDGTTTSPKMETNDTVFELDEREAMNIDSEEGTANHKFSGDEAMNEEHPDETVVLDPQETLCQYELLGECADPYCMFQHMKPRLNIDQALTKEMQRLPALSLPLAISAHPSRRNSQILVATDNDRKYSTVGSETDSRILKPSRKRARLEGTVVPGVDEQPVNPIEEKKDGFDSDGEDFVPLPELDEDVSNDRSDDAGPEMLISAFGPEPPPNDDGSTAPVPSSTRCTARPRSESNFWPGAIQYRPWWSKEADESDNDEDGYEHDDDLSGDVPLSVEGFLQRHFRLTLDMNSESQLRPTAKQSRAMGFVFVVPEKWERSELIRSLGRWTDAMRFVLHCGRHDIFIGLANLIKKVCCGKASNRLRTMYFDDFLDLFGHLQDQLVSSWKVNIERFHSRLFNFHVDMAAISNLLRQFWECLCLGDTGDRRGNNPFRVWKELLTEWTKPTHSTIFSEGPLPDLRHGVPNSVSSDGLSSVEFSYVGGQADCLAHLTSLPTQFDDAVAETKRAIAALHAAKTNKEGLHGKDRLLCRAVMALISFRNATLIGLNRFQQGKLPTETLDQLLTTIMSTATTLSHVDPLCAVSLGPIAALWVSIRCYDRRYGRAQQTLENCLTWYGPIGLAVYSDILWCQLIQIRCSFPFAPNKTTDSNEVMPSYIQSINDEHDALVDYIHRLGIDLNYLTLVGDHNLGLTAGTKSSGEMLRKRTFVRSLLTIIPSTGETLASGEAVDRKRGPLALSHVHLRPPDASASSTTQDSLFFSMAVPRSLLMVGLSGLVSLKLSTCGLKDLPRTFGKCFPSLKVMQCNAMVYFI